MQTIELDLATRRIVPLLHAKQNDVGKKVAVVLTDNGAAYSIPGDAVFSVWYSGASGEGNYTTIGEKSAFSVSGNTVAVELILQMLQNPGPGQMCLVMNREDGKQIGLWNIPYFVEAIPGADSEEATAYYTAFLEAVQGMGVAGIESTAHPGCYYRLVNGETEWLNPPMVPSEEYRTSERYMGKAVYTTIVECGVPSNGATVDFPFDYSTIFRCSGVLGSSVVLPYTITGKITEDWQGIGVSVQNGKITIICGGGREGYGDVYCQIWYTKN